MRIPGYVWRNRGMVTPLEYYSGHIRTEGDLNMIRGRQITWAETATVHVCVTKDYLRALDYVAFFSEVVDIAEERHAKDAR